MNKYLLPLLLCCYCGTGYAQEVKHTSKVGNLRGENTQKQTYEFTTFTPPKTWKKEVKANTYTSYSIINNQKKTYCQILIMLSTTSKGGIKEDFESEWVTLVAKQYGVTDTARRTAPTTQNGWQVLGGVGFFTSDNGTSTAMLTTMSGYNKAVSIVTLTNSEDYIPAIRQFLESVEMKKPNIGIAETKKLVPRQVIISLHLPPPLMMMVGWQLSKQVGFR